MWIRTSELIHMGGMGKLSFTIAILLRQYMMELLNCHLLSFTLILDSLILSLHTDSRQTDKSFFKLVQGHLFILIFPFSAVLEFHYILNRITAYLIG